MVRLSLVIATYNRSQSLVQVLESVVCQNAPLKEWECIVVNNNSTDDTVERFNRFVARHPEHNIRMVEETNQGLSYARNRGISESVGQYVAIIDDDERIAPEFIAAYIDLFDSTPDAMAAGGPIVAEYPTGRPRWMSAYTERPIANTMYFGDKVREFPEGRIPGGGNMAMRRMVFDVVDTFDTSLGRTGKRLIGGEESDLFERMAKQAMRCYYVPEAVMYHIIPEEKLSEEYFDRLTYNIGVSQLTRATLHNRRLRLYVGEVAKWVATLLLCLVHRPVQSRYLLKLRYNISRGIFQGER